MKKIFILIIITLVLLPIVNNLPNKTETKKYYSNADNNYLVKTDPGGGG